MNLSKHWAAQLGDYAIDLDWEPGGASIAAASTAGPVTVFSAADGALQCELSGHDQGTNVLAWAPASTGVLATGGQDGAVKFWDAASGQHTGTAAVGTGWVDHIAWRPKSDKPALLAASAGRKLAFLNPDGSVRHVCSDAAKTISALAWEPGGGCVAAACFGGVRLWDADDFVVQKELDYANAIHALAWSPDSRWLVSGNQDPSVHLWVPAEDLELHMSGYEGKVKHVSFDHTSRWLATSGGRSACVWDCSAPGPEGREPVMLGHDAPVCALAFQRRHGLLAAGGQDGALILWSPERKQPLRATIRMPSAATTIAWSPDDRLLAVGTETGVVYVLRCEN